MNGGAGWSVEAESDCDQLREPFLQELLGLPHAGIQHERPSGSLEVVPQGAASLLVEGEPYRGPHPLLVVTLWPLDYRSTAEHPAFEISLRDLYGPTRVSPVLAGTYRLQFRPPLDEADAASLPETIAIAPGALRLPLDISGYGYVLADLRDATGRPYAGQAGLRVMEGPREALLVSASFAGPPYVLCVPRATEAELRLTSPLPPGRREPVSVPVRIEPGRATEVVVPMGG